MNDLSDRLFFLVEYLDLPEATGDPEAAWEIFQAEHLNNNDLLGIERKARQIGWSWTAAAEAVAESVIVPRSTNVFVSINLDEAAEKIRYANQIILALDRDVRPALITDNKLELEFQNGSRLISHPCRPVRGKARANVYLDEFAHYPKDREIYTSALPVTTRGGRLRIGSSPLGAVGMFWEIYTEEMRTYPGFVRGWSPWWLVKGLCKDVGTARQVAVKVDTEERVKAFGTDRLITIFENMFLEDFKQEYECDWVDESVSWITWDEIKRNQIDAADGNLWYKQATTVADAMVMIDRVAKECSEGNIEAALAGGMDVGRRRNLSEIILLGRASKSASKHPYRLGISLFNVEFDDQEAVVTKILKTLPITAFMIDETGLGMQLAENMKRRFPIKVHPAGFTAESKELWSIAIKIAMQRGNLPIPMDRDLSYQVHSMKKKITAAKNVVFDTEGNQKHHADKYWALALANAAVGVIVKKYKRPGIVQYA